jgi:UDP:flavonoid glycosyltransferase YjiC (YdhE family)
VVIAHISEQEHWARERAGVAGKLARRSTDAATLAQHIGEVLRMPDVKPRAAALARAMALENGVAQAVRLIHERIK